MVPPRLTVASGGRDRGAQRGRRRGGGVSGSEAEAPPLPATQSAWWPPPGLSGLRAFGAPR